MTYVADPSVAKKPGPRLALAIIVIVLGTIVGISGLAVAITKVVHEFSGTVYVSPGSVHRHLTPGTYEVFEGVVSDTDQTPLTGRGIAASDVIVTSSDGQTLTTYGPGANETLTRGSSDYAGVVEFKVVTEGDYDIDVEGASGQSFFITSSFGDLAKHAAGWFVMMGLGILIGIAGVILLIVGIVRRGKFKRAMAPAYAGGYPPGYGTVAPAPLAGDPAVAPPAANLPAAGWYPDPQIPGTQRWWDGTRWTDQTQSS